MTMHKTRIEITTPMKAPINTRSVSLPTRGLSSLKGSSESRGLVRPVPVALSVTFLFSGIVCFLVSARVDAPEVVAALFAVAVATEVLVVRFSVNVAGTWVTGATGKKRQIEKIIERRGGTNSLSKNKNKR